MQRIVVVLVAALVIACGGPSTPTTPTATKVSLTGLVYNQLVGTGAGLANARVEITAGPGAGRSATADGSGRYRFDNLDRGNFTLRVALDGFQTLLPVLTVNGNLESNFGLTPTSVSVSGTTINVLNGAAIGGVSIAGGASSATSDGSGNFIVAGAPNVTAPTVFTFTAPGFVERQTGLKLPGNNASVSLIPSSFDLASFDTMFRTPLLRRWVNPPPIVIEQRVAQFVDTESEEATLIEFVTSDGETNAMLNDLNAALGNWSGGVFTSFASVSRQASASGSSFRMFTNGRITVIRMKGMLDKAGAIGLGQWSYFDDGRIAGGAVMLDFDFDRSGHALVPMVRAHELGHAMGIEHVDSRTSVMNTFAGVTAFTAFDLEAGRLAYQRPAGNHAPDVDPATASANPLSGRITLSPRIR